MKERVAVYPGTFDPVTFGHLDVIRASSAIFDRVIVGLLRNALKNPHFSEDERKKMIEEAVADLGIANVEVKTFDGLTVELARQEKALAIIRGLRLTTEYENELNIILNNRLLAPEIIPVLLPPQQEHIHISSSTVRELLKFGHSDSDLDKYVPRAVLEYAGIMEKRYKARLRQICNRICGSDAAGALLCQTIIRNYQSTPRFYHSLKHINDCLDEFEAVKYLLPNQGVVEMAILFHDAVYDARAEDNEEKSAKLAQKTISMLLPLPSSFGESVAKLILATKHDIQPTDFDAQILTDIDLAPLGCPETIFDRNRIKVREEYHHLTEGEFMRGNSAFLKSLLEKRPSIYSTQFFRDKYEAQARKNIARAIAQLSK